MYYAELHLKTIWSKVAVDYYRGLDVGLRAMNQADVKLMLSTARYSFSAHHYVSQSRSKILRENITLVMLSSFLMEASVLITYC